jgi:hypothetical protein
MTPAPVAKSLPLLQRERIEPMISILLPFDPKITPRDTLSKRLELAVMRVKEELDRHYPIEETYMLMVRLRKLANGLNYGTFKRSIAIYLSAAVEKVFYLDMDVNEQIVADGALTMRHLIERKADAYNCLLLLLSAERVKIFHAADGHLKRLLTVTPSSMSSRTDDVPERVSNFSDPSSLKELMLDKFMRYANHTLEAMLAYYPFPVIVMAAERTAGHFKKVSGNNIHVAAYIHGNFEDASEACVKQAIAPYMEKWQKLKQYHLLSILDKAMGSGKVAAGIRDVCKESSMHKGRLLLVENSFRYKLDIADVKGKEQKPFYLQDKVDEAILNVLESGGEVEFVEDGMLAAYGQVALIKYY